MIVDGKKIAAEILTKIKAEIANFETPPVLGVVLVGQDKASTFYVERKRKACENVGITFKLFKLAEDILQEDLEKELIRIQEEEGLNGLIVQLPLPKQLDTDKILDLIDPAKDVDCLTTENLKNLEKENPFLLPPTPAAIFAILDYYQIDLADKKAVMVGHGRLVGAPTCTLLAHKTKNSFCTNSAIDNLSTLQEADVIITGVGKPKIITAEMIKDGAVVIDAGVSVVNGSSVGDIDFENIKDKASLVSPVIGGVGPVTVAKLLENVVKVSR